MPAWLIVVLAAAWVGVPAIGCYLGVRSVLREIEAEKEVEARAGDAFLATVGAQRSNPRGVGRHDWPL